MHGGIDGFSRLIVYLNAATNNRASTVLDSFRQAVYLYGVPSLVRSDKGGENIDVAHYMLTSRRVNRNSHISGRSVHNQRYSESEFGLFAMYVIQTWNLLWQGGANTKHIQILN